VPSAPVVPLVREKVRAGTRNLSREPAMTRDEAMAAIAVGERMAVRAVEAGHDVLAAGEIGIGNTTSAAALVCAFTGASPAEVVGYGTGIGEATRQRKVGIVERALSLHGSRDALDVLAALGGLELAAMTGYVLASARRRVPVILDGFLATSAALGARALDGRVVDYLLVSHASAERGASLAAAALPARPLLDLDMRLGEGTGALLAVDLLRTAVDLQLSMATFATAGVVGRSGLAGES
jgi:nicotinate-nucleotide--dimethylbenzimidazole phosphoribosyltransferase